MERLKEWFRAEREKMAGYSPLEIAGYIWQYYKLWIIGIAFFLLFGGWAVLRILTTPGERWFFACFANTYADLGDGTAFCNGFADYAGYDLHEKTLEFNDSIYCDPTNRIDTFTNQYYQSLVAFMDSGALDVLVMEQDQLLALGSVGRLLDLEDARMGDFAVRWADRLVFCTPSEGDYGKSEVPVGIDLRGSRLVGDYRAYPDGAVLGVNALAEHLDQVEIFLDYLFEEAE